MKILLLSGSSITAIYQLACVFGRKNIVGQYTFAATFSKIVDIVWLGVIDTQNKNTVIWNKNYVSYYNDGDCNVGADRS